MKALFLDAGRLRSEVILQAAIPVEDGAGGHSEEWSEVARLFAAVEPLRAQSRFGAGQFLEAITHKVTLRYRPDLRSGMRFLRAGRALEIVTVQDPDETGRYLTCLVREEGR